MQSLEIATPDGLKLVGDSVGRADAPTVVLLHGGGQTRHAWFGMMRRLVRIGYRAIAYDARGHGDSDWAGNGNYSVLAMAADLRAILKGIDGPVALVGASLGGITSFFAVGAEDCPTVGALIMVDVVLRPTQVGTERIKNFMSGYPRGFATLEDAADAVTAYNPHRPQPSDPRGLAKNLRRRADGRYYWHWDLRLLDQPTDARRARLLIGVSDKVTIPTMVVRGSASDVIDDAGLAEMKKLLPQLQVRSVPGAGHMIAGDRNDEFGHCVIDFLRDYMPPGSC